MRIERTVTAAGSASSWEPVDLKTVLAGSLEPLRPTVGERDDGQHLLYPGKTHIVSSEPEAGKTWLALHFAAQQIRQGRSALYIDFEDDVRAIVGRLRGLGLADAALEAHFLYVRPTVKISATVRARLVELIGRRHVSLVVIDGVTEALAAQGRNLSDNTDVAHFFRDLPVPLADAGAAVVLLDHETKAQDARGRFGIGAQHKLAAVSGAAYKLSSGHPFARGSTGSSTLRMVKDRHGSVRSIGGGVDRVVGELVVSSTDDDVVQVEFRAQLGQVTAVRRNEEIEQRLISGLTEHGEPVPTKTGVYRLARGNGQQKTDALNRLIDDGRVVHTDDGYQLAVTAPES